MIERCVLEARVVTGSGGGPDKTILNTPRWMKDRGYPTTCVYLRDPRDGGFAEIERRALDLPAPLEAVDDFGAFDWRVVGRLRRLCERVQPKIWHGHDYKSNLLGLILRRRRPMLLITTVHGWVQQTWKTPLYYAVDRRCLPRYAAVVCVSKDLHDDCLRLGVAADRCFHVPNGVDTDAFRRRTSVAAAKTERNIPPTRLVFGAAGRLSEEKGFDLLLQALAELLRAGADVELHLAGDGGERAALERLAASLGVADRVHLAGFIADMRSFYEPLDVFVLSSRREGLPNVLLEAMAFGLPCVATRIAGVPMLIKDDVNGLLVDPESAASLTAGMRRTSDEILRARLGDAARELVVREYSFARRMDVIKGIYDQAWDREPPR